MAFDINQKKDFSFQGGNFAGNLKPDKVKARKVTEKVSGHMPVDSGSFGNHGT